MKLNPQVYRDAVNKCNVRNINKTHWKAFYAFMNKPDDEIFQNWEELSTALLFMAHITEDENENKETP